MRCPECGFRANDRICPLCGVKMRREDGIRTHVHSGAREDCVLPNTDTPSAQPKSRPATHVHRETGEQCVLPNREKTARRAAPKSGWNRVVSILVGAIVLILLESCQLFF